MKQWTNTPDWGIQPIGEPVDNCTTCLIVKWPARMVAKVLPVGAVSAPVAVVVNVIVPVVFWAGAAYLISRKLLKR